MIRHRLKNEGKRYKAFLGADGAIMAAATLAAAGMTTAATISSANKQAASIKENAKTQSEALKQQIENDSKLNMDSLNLQKDMQRENTQIQKDAQLTLNMLASQQNANERAEANKKELKYGGRKNVRKSLKRINPNNAQFTVTDGGTVVPLMSYSDGSILYEAIGNDHEHYHKTHNGKYKSGVGLKLNNGEVLEIEGNQNSNKGELILDDKTNNSVLAISKHNINGYNPTNAVLNGEDPRIAFAIQQELKAKKGLKDDGSTNNNYKQNIAKCGTKRSLKRNKAAWGDYAGATYQGAGNLLGAGITMIGNMVAGNKLADAYNEYGNMMAEAYSKMKGIDLKEIQKENYVAPHTLAVIRRADTNINPQLERERRNTTSEKKAISKNIISSAARNNLLGSINDRSTQRLNELYSYKHNEDEKIKQTNAERITNTANENANRDIQSNRDYTSVIIDALKYNNDIDNQKIMGMASSRAGAMTSAASVRSNALASSLQGLGNALSNTATGFANSYNAVQQEKNTFATHFDKLDDIQQVDAAIRRYQLKGDKSYLKSLQKQYAPKIDSDGNNIWVDINGNSDIIAESRWNKINKILNKAKR